MEEIVEKLEKIIVRENAKLRNELRNELKDELKNELKKELKSEISQELRKQLLDYMFVFEENYGRKINIMFEELVSKNQKIRNLEENAINLEKRVDKNSAFVFNHEKRITTLEEAKV